MKLPCLLLLSALAAAVAAPNAVNEKHEIFALDTPAEVTSENRNILVQILVNQVIAYIRRVINDGSSLLGIPPLDPLELESFHLDIPAGLINLSLDLENIYATGFGGFVTHKTTLTLSDLTFDLDISVPKVHIRADHYDFNGDLFSAIPLFGKGEALFEVENFRFQAKLYLKQSDDGLSVLIDRIENTAFQIPSFKSALTGVIGGGSVDAIANALIEEVFIGYVNRFQGVIAIGVSQAIVAGANPILDKLDTWKYIANLI